MVIRAIVSFRYRKLVRREKRLYLLLRRDIFCRSIALFDIVSLAVLYPLELGHFNFDCPLILKISIVNFISKCMENERGTLAFNPADS